ncbi:MAG: TonB-dependent receptor [Bacteroidota bacterium]
MRRRIVLVSGFTALFFSSLGTAILAAANSNIEGYVKDAVTGAPLPYANVVIVRTRFGAAADINGRYTIRDVPAGSYMLRASYIGYKPVDVPIGLKEGTNVTMDFKLEPVGVQGEEVVVTAQALGQKEAINEQLASEQIVNEVSAARIQELPDANAAESVGRLPGVSVQRDGGEGNKVVIRGLSPKYNAIMINGVRMTSTDDNDRSVDLSMISPNMLEGIEVMKAITPDQDADALGGSVNFKMREAKGSNGGPGFDLLTQGGYNSLATTYNDYKFVGSVDNRFFEDRFGVFAQADVERKNRISNELGASYYLNGPKLGAPNETYLGSLNLADIPRDRKRVGGTLVLDYRLPYGKISFTNFLSSTDTRTQSRGEGYDLAGNNHSYATTDSREKLSVMTNILYYEQVVSFLRIDASASHSYSENSSPDNMSFSFLQQSVGFNGQPYGGNPELIPSFARNDPSQTFLQTVSDYDQISKDRDIAGTLNVQFDEDLSSEINSTLKFGGKYRYKYRYYDHNEGGGLLGLLATGGNVRQAILDAFPWMKATVPIGLYRFPITIFEDQNFNYGTFLGGDYPLGVPTNIGLMWQVLDVMKQFASQNPGSFDAYSRSDFGSTTNNYSGNEYGTAGYGMADVNIGPQIKLIPGVRYERLATSYTGARGISGITGASHNYVHYDTTLGTAHDYWLPMVHLRYKPTEWFDVRFAYTNTLTYPDYTTITPRIDVGFNSVDWNNYQLKPGHSTNYDLYLSLYENTLGLFTAGGFLKRIDDLIFPATGRIISDPSLYEGVPAGTQGYTINTYINDPNRVDVLGIELDWQTHFWYLPNPLRGTVLNVNYTHIFSDAKYPRTTYQSRYLFDSLGNPIPPYVVKTISDTFYTDRLINQPDDIVNIAVGYDYAGFSTRLSMLYQTDIFAGTNFWPEIRTSTASYVRWDLSVKQDLPWFGVQVFLDINNINAARDVSLNEGSSFPAAEQHYGMTADLGLRWRL